MYINTCIKREKIKPLYVSIYKLIGFYTRNLSNIQGKAPI